MTTDTATFSIAEAIKITKQPVSVNVGNGKTARVSLEAQGEGLSYQWYYKNRNDKEFKLTNSYKTSEYSIVMNDSRDGRQIYCVVTDRYGNSITSKTVTLKMINQVKIIKQPVSVTAKNGEEITVTLKAEGDGLKYQWYYNSGGMNDFQLTGSFTGNSYTVTMSPQRAGRQIYCIVSDKYGNREVSDVIVLKLRK